MHSLLDTLDQGCSSSRIKMVPGVGDKIEGDPAFLEQVVLALLDNAITSNRPGGRVMVCTAVKDEQALLQVEDTGSALPANTCRTWVNVSTESTRPAR